MKKILSLIVSVLLCGAFACTAFPEVRAHANSAQRYWRGRDAFGAYIKEENCPVIVEKERLTLRIPDFPKEYYECAEELESYTADVTAEYTFHNPESYDVEMTLVFPFGVKPDYLDDTYVDGERVEIDDTARYAITADGEEVQRTVRHTLSDWTGDPAKDLSRLSEVPRTNGAFSRDTPVTVYHYRQITTENTSDHSFIEASFKGLGNVTRTKVMLSACSGGNTEDDRIGLWGAHGTSDGSFSLYVIGDPLYRMPEWKVYESAACTAETEGSVVADEKLPAQTTTLHELFMGNYREESGVSETDWFNAVFDNVWEDRQTLSLRADASALNVSSLLMRWYEYELTVPAGKSVVNSVSAPLYPDIDLGWEPPVYSYTYLLSPASTWAEFGDFEVAVETPYFLSDGSLSFEKGENGYALSQKGLPQGELTFKLSPSENPERLHDSGKEIAFFFTYFWWVILLAVVAAAALVVAIVLLARKKKKKSAENQ